MTDDRDLERRLVAADAACRTPAGAPITANRLRQRLRRRRTATMAATAAIVLLALLVSAQVSFADRLKDRDPHRPTADTSERVLLARARSLLAGAERLLTQRASPTIRANANRRVRYELALARANALTDSATATDDHR